MVISRRRGRNTHLLDYLQVNDEIDLWEPNACKYTPCRITHALPGDYHRLQFSDGAVDDVNLRMEQWRFAGQSAIRVWTSLHPSSPTIDRFSTQNTTSTSAP